MSCHAVTDVDALIFKSGGDYSSSQSPLRNTTVKTLTQVWRVGSTVPGHGWKVQTDTVYKYEDHAIFDVIVSPVSQ